MTRLLSTDDLVQERWIRIEPSAVIQIDASLGRNFRIRLDQNVTLRPPQHPSPGQHLVFRFEQDATGSRTVTFSGYTTSGTVSIDSTALSVTFVEMFYNDRERAWELKGVVGLGSYQPLDATLTSISALGTVANRSLYTTGVDTWAEYAISADGRTWASLTAGAPQRTALGLGTAYAASIAAAQTDSTAAALADLVTDFNALLAKLRAAGLMSP